MGFQKSILKPISTNATVIPSIPDVTIDNPIDADSFVNGIELILSAEFSKKGKLLILVNEVSVFDENDSNAFEGYGKFPIPLGKKLKRSNDIQIFAWNGDDSNTITAKVNLSLSKELLPFNSQAELLGKDILNRVISNSLTLFAQDDFADETKTILLDMEGYKKLIVIIAGATADALTLTSSSFGNGANAVDQDLSSKTANVLQQGGGSTISLVADYGSSVTKAVAGKVAVVNVLGTSSLTMKIETSPDNSVWTTRITNAGVSVGDTILSSGATQYTFRYLRITSVHNLTSNDRSNVAVYELYDPEFFGGTGSLSFEVKDAQGNWVEMISASDIGTISTGASITKQIGDVQTDVSTSKFNEVLPSTQTDFRAKFVVVGNLSTNVQAIKVS